MKVHDHLSRFVAGMLVALCAGYASAAAYKVAGPDAPKPHERTGVGADSARQAQGVERRILKGAIGEKARRLFENRLLSKKARGDIFEETVKAFRTNYDDKHPDPQWAKRHSGYWQGEYWGKTMLSHCAYARCTGDAEEREFIHRSALSLVESFQRADGYLGTYADADFIKGWNWNIWGRKYTMWALVEAYDLTNDVRLLDAARRMAAHIRGQLRAQGLSIGDTGCFAGLPSMSLLKPLVMLWRRTGDEDVRGLIEHIVSDNDRADGRRPNLLANAFSDKPVHTWYKAPDDWAKAYELMSVVEGLIEYGEAFGKPRPIEAAKRIFDKLAEDEMNGVCSVGYHDHFVGARAYPNTISESCDVIHWMRLCKFLYKTTGEKRYLDHWERAFLNAFLAGVFRDGKWGTHDVRGHGKRHLQGLFEVNMLYHFCCIANDPRGFCDYADMAVEAAAQNRLNLNFFTDGEYVVNGVRIAVSGGYPVGNRVSVKVKTAKPTTLCLRVPADCCGLNVAGAPVPRESAGRLAVAVPAGETELSLAFDLPLRVESWRTDKPQDPSLDRYLLSTFEMPGHNKEMVGFARKAPGVRVFRGPMLLAKCMLVGDSDAEVFEDLGVDETCKATLSPRRCDGVWGCWNVTFEKGAVRKSVCAGDYQSAADFDSWQNSFSIWF